MFRLRLDAPDGKLVRVGLGRGLRAPYAAKRIPASASDLRNYLATYIDSMAARDLFSGVVLVGRGDSILFERARGTTATSFDVASVGKMFTAIAIGQLAEQGKRTLDATIDRYDSSLPSAIASRITVRQLLGHTSGLGELGPELDSAMAVTEHVPQMMQLLRDTTLHFPPGTKFEYSNRGYLALGEIIERVTGENYFDYIKRHVFALAGMKDSKFVRFDAKDPSIAVRYSRFATLRSAYAPGPRFATTARLDVRGGPAGGAFVSARDLFKFGRGVANAKLINATMRDLFTRASGEVPWGLGFELGANGAYGHRGGAPGATSYFFHLPASVTRLWC